MIVSIGIDIIEVVRIREVLLRTPRFAERVFTKAERAYCDSRGVVAAQHYAARFAAKEAALKALALDDKLAEAHASFGQITSYYDYDFLTAEREYRRAIELTAQGPARRFLEKRLAALSA